jgi:hypothetical protein
MLEMGMRAFLLPLMMIDQVKAKVKLADHQISHQVIHNK